MFFTGIFFLELVVLFFSSTFVINILSQTFFGITKSRKTTIYLLAFLFFPGTVVHELAHLLMAMLIRVPTGHIELFPKINEGGVRLGSVQIARSDPFRRFFIGIAPLVVGLGVVFWVIGGIRESGEIWVLAVGAYALFIITNTMFSSKRDMDGAVPLVAVVTIFVIALYIVGLRVPEGAIREIGEISAIGAKLLVIPLGINGLVSLIRFIFRSGPG